MNNNNRIIGLDVLRSAAITMVLLLHSGSMFLPLAKLPIIGKFIGKFLAVIIPIGYLGVELFFVLSGFLITTILLKQFLSENNTTLKSVKHFWIRRWFRTLPNYFLVLTLNYIVFVFILKKYAFDWKYMFFVQNLYDKQTSFFRESWSLSIEEWSYLILPIVMLLFISIMKNTSTKMKLLFSLVTIVLCTFFAKVIFLLNNQNKNILFDEQLRKVIVYRIDAVVYGAFMAWLNYYYSEILNNLKAKLFIIGIVFLAFLVYYFYINDNFEYKNTNLSNLFIYSNYLFWLPFVGIGFALLIPYFSKLIIFKIKLVNTFFEFLSKISYSLYLVHFPIYSLFFFKRLPFNSIFQSLINISIYFTSCIFVSYILYRFFELPILKYRDKHFTKSTITHTVNNV